MTTEERQDYIAKHITNEDIDAWSPPWDAEDGTPRISPHLAKLMRDVNAHVIQVWGYHGGSEPVSIVIEE